VTWEEVSTIVSGPLGVQGWAQVVDLRRLWHAEKRAMVERRYFWKLAWCYVWLLRYPPRVTR
jgi:hypothetical protein